MSTSENLDEFLPGDFRVEFLDHTTVDGADAVRITVTGELDLATGPTLLRHLDHNTLLHASPTAELVVDLAKLEFIDAAGARALIHAAAGRSVRLINISRPVRRFFDLTGLPDTMIVHS